MHLCQDVLERSILSDMCFILINDKGYTRFELEWTGIAFMTHENTCLKGAAYMLKKCLILILPHLPSQNDSPCPTSGTGSFSKWLFTNQEPKAGLRHEMDVKKTLWFQY